MLASAMSTVVLYVISYFCLMDRRLVAVDAIGVVQYASAFRWSMSVPINSESGLSIYGQKSSWMNTLFIPCDALIIRERYLKVDQVRSDRLRALGLSVK